MTCGATLPVVRSGVFLTVRVACFVLDEQVMWTFCERQTQAFHTLLCVAGCV